jgi:anti-anti-sigma factor
MSYSFSRLQEWAEGEPIGDSGLVACCVSGRLDSVSSDDAEKRLLELLEAGVRGVVVDLSALDFLASAGLRVLLVLARRVSAGSGVVVLVAPKPEVLQVLELSGMVGVLKVCPDRAAARALLG